MSAPAPAGSDTGKDPRISHHRQSRNQMLLSAMILCAIGLASQMQTLHDLSAKFTGGDSTRKQQREMDTEEHHHLAGNLFVPSLEFTANVGSGSSGGAGSKAHSSILDVSDCSRRVKEPDWEWYNTEPSVETGKNSTRRLLIALFAGHDKYAHVLEYSAHLAKVYSQIHPETSVVVSQGMVFAPGGCSPPAVYTTLNKIRLLFHAVDHEEDYDQLLLLNADTLLVDLNFDITTLLPENENEDHKSILLAAQPVLQDDNPTPPPPYRINADATLWNLHHPNISQVAHRWFEDANNAALKGRYRGDQKFLQAALETQSDYENEIQLLQDGFAYHDGTVIRHVIQHGTQKWQDRQSKLIQAARQICEQTEWKEACNAVPRRTYPTQ